MVNTMTSLFHSPTELIIGRGSLSKVVEIIDSQHVKRVFVVTDYGLRRAGIIDALTNSLQLLNTEYVIFDRVEPDPTEELVQTAYVELSQFNADLIIAIGGGSSIDTAKAIGILATNGGHISDYKGVGKVQQPILPLIAIPTTAGTGSEVTAVTVVTNVKEKLKYSIGGTHVAAKWAVIDAELTLTVPPHITAFTGIDALTHAIEAYTSKLSFSVTDSLAKEAIKLISANLRTAVYQGKNVSARKNMLEGSLLAGLAFGNAKLGLCHVLCNPLGAHYNIPHGLANAILLPYVTQFNIAAQLEKYSHIVQFMGESTEGLSVRASANLAVKALQTLNADVNIPLTLDDVGVKESSLEKMVEDCYTNPLVSINPRTASKDDLLKIYQNAYHGR